MTTNIWLFMLIGFCSCVPSQYQYAANLHDIIHQINAPNSLKCDVCKGAVKAIGLAFRVGLGREEVKKVAKYICDKFEIESHRVCVMAIDEFMEEVWGIFSHAIFVPDEICGIALGDGCAQKPKYFDSWNITVPKQTKDTPTTSNFGIKTGKGATLKVLHISDTHLDNDYMEGSFANCAEPLCCRKQDGKAGPGQIPAGKYGYPGFCDTNHLMLNTMFQHMVEQHNDADYIIWTGDVPAHNVWNQSRASQTAAIRQATNLLRKYFPTKRIFPALGNHEGVPVNSFPPPEIWSWTIPSDEWLYEELAKDWVNWLPEECLTTIKKGGYYTTLIRKGLRIVSLNTNFGHADNWWLSVKSDDPANQLKWLTQVLFEAEKNGEIVHIIGHIPTNELLKWWSINYYRIIDRFRNTIAAQFFGHTHHDEYRVFYDMRTFKTPISVEYIGPSVTTYHDINPGYRVYELDAGHANSSLSIVDHHTYILNLTNVDKTGIAKFQLEYSAKSSFKMKDLSPKSWSDLISRMDKDDQLFQIFYRAFYKQHVKEECVGECKESYLCVLKTAVEGYHDFCAFQNEEERNMHVIWKSKTYNKC